MRERLCRQAAEDIIAYSALATACVELFRNLQRYHAPEPALEGIAVRLDADPTEAK